jgi:hypothetical protein
LGSGERIKLWDTMAATNDAEMFQMFAKMTIFLHTVINYKESYMLMQDYHALLKGIFQKFQEKSDFKAGQKVFNRSKADSVVNTGGSILKRSSTQDSGASGGFEESEISPERTPNIKNPDEKPFFDKKFWRKKLWKHNILVLNDYIHPKAPPSVDMKSNAMLEQKIYKILKKETNWMAELETRTMDVVETNEAAFSDKLN